MFSNVLLIEDNETTNYIHKIVLGNIGIVNVNEALNGLEAFKYLEKDCPDIIFLDINMPVMDGWEFLKERETKALCNDAKIAMLTSSTHPDDKKQAENYKSVIAYIEKPLTKDKIQELKQKISAS
ncbi:response regulator [Flagellimonas crocea]|uniref:response regulator n=1 Tax=Flagellimonas crocea TaxID=3067311 RepID=UPI00296E4900|nr:response regulator [Muricauda sp. DH64]